MRASPKSAVVVFCAALAVSRLLAQAPSAPDPTRFEKNVLAYEAADTTAPPPTGAILLAGDSQFYRWKTLAEDLPGYTIVNRGIDSFQSPDLLHYLDRLVLRYEPRMIVLHVGGNDVHNGRTAEQVLADFKTFVSRVRAVHPSVPIAFTSITPSPGRWSEADVRREANRLVKAYTATQPLLHFIDLWDAFLGPDGKPREDLYGPDRIHPNHDGYLVRAKIMRPLLSAPDVNAPRFAPRHYDPICQVWLDPSDKFTRVVPDRQPSIRVDANLAAITVNYTGFTPQAQVAFQHAVNIWQNALTSAIPTVVNATFQDLGNPFLLGSAGPATFVRDWSTTPRPATWFPVAIANKIAGADLNGAGGVEIGAEFNSTAAWYFGTDGNTPSGQIDFVSVVLHELGHGLGFVGSGTVNASGQGSIGFVGFPTIYDAFTSDGANNALLNAALYPNGSLALGNALVSGNVFWSGANGVAANGGARPRLYAPNPFVQGSSYSHLDEATFPAGNPNSLMTPLIGTAEAIHSPGGVTLGIFTDSGWTPAPACTYTLGATNFPAPQGGITGATVNVTAPAGCPWTAVSNNPGFITITAGASGNGSGTVVYSVSANVSSYRTGTMTIAGQTFTVTQNGLGPVMTLDKTSLRFGAVSTGSSFVAQTSAQVVRLRQSGAGSVSWIATPLQPWLQVSPSSGTGSADLSITVTFTGGIPAVGTSLGAITIAFTGAANSPGPITVNLRTILNGTSAAPFGTVDTPLDNQTNVAGSVPFTGWALDDTEVAVVSVCRLAIGTEVAPIDPNCGSQAEIFLGFALFIDGARPDVAGAFPTYPRNTRGGWGFMVLTNMLPGQGNGTYAFHMWARDREGLPALLGTRTMTCNNAASVQPFGAIDTPTQGGVASGNNYVNFGWALAGQPTPSERFIPTNGSTIGVIVDGVFAGSPSYNHFRSDIASLFPGYANSNGAVGFRIIDTTAMANGLHTISWTITDNMGSTAGVGSRYFTVSNGAAAMTTAAETAATALIGWRGEPMSMRRVDALPLDVSAIGVRRGWRLDAGYRAQDADQNGRTVVESEEVNRVEIAFDASNGDQYIGYVRSAGDLAPLPVGSSLDPSTGVFTWAPGVGFVGKYDLVFVRLSGGEPVSRYEVRVILHPRRSVAPHLLIDRR